MEHKVARYEKVYGKPEKDSIETILEKKDKKRASYYKFYTGNRWDDINNYDLVINTSKIGFDEATDVIIDYINKMN